MTGATSVRLASPVLPIETETLSTSALLLHPFRPLVVACDGRGTVRVYNLRHGAFTNVFHLAEGRPTAVQALWQVWLANLAIYTAIC